MTNPMLLVPTRSKENGPWCVIDCADFGNVKIIEKGLEDEDEAKLIITLINEEFDND